jgi:hypothetical protein
VECKSCPQGYSQANLSQSTCNMCLPGQFQIATGSTSCKE